MTEFASAAMVRVLVQGMRELGLKPPPEHVPAGSRGATVDLDLKRRLVQSAWQQGGIGCLALLGRGLHCHAHDPTHRALASAGGPAELLERWTRLERYIHSHHRVRVLAATADSARTQHVALGSRPPPSAAEDLVVLGVLAALLEAIGASEVAACAGGVPAYPRPDAAALAQAAQRGDTGSWDWTWRFDAADSRAPRAGTVAPAGPPLEQLVLAEPWPDVAKQAFALIAGRLANPLRMAAVASGLQMSPRSMQRALQRAGLSCEALLAQARCRSSAWWLLNTPTSIAEVGFLAGYADQPHFTRDFKARTGITPRTYRIEFSAPTSTMRK
jgi:AraC-like DNA-binding protein